MNSDKIDVLQKSGWERRFVTDLARVEEWVKLYTEMGFEARVVPYESDNTRECDVCVAGDADNMRVIYTRMTSKTGENEREGKD
jgi:hypothetical protein